MTDTSTDGLRKAARRVFWEASRLDQIRQEERQKIRDALIDAASELYDDVAAFRIEHGVHGLGDWRDWQGSDPRWTGLTDHQKTCWRVAEAYENACDRIVRRVREQLDPEG
jgi:hypothetical protein